MTHVFYHGKCPDGELSAAIWKKFIPKSIFHPWIHPIKNKNPTKIQKLPLKCLRCSFLSFR